MEPAGPVRTFSTGRFVALLICLAAGAVLVAGSSASANWLTKLAREAGDAGGSAARYATHHVDDIGGLGRFLKTLPNDGRGPVMAAHVTPEGHWKFTNRDGEVFTAASAEEMSRVLPTLLPDHAPGGPRPVRLYLSEDTVFQRPTMIEGLPGNLELHLLTAKRSYRLQLLPKTGARPRYAAQVKPNLVVELTDRQLFDEAIWQLERPLSKSSVRVLALEPGGPQTLTTAPKLDGQTKAALIDRIDPWKLPAALSSVRGQTVVVTGRIDGEFLHFAASGGEKSVLVADLAKAARDADVNLVMLRAADPRQPGGRNWLWQSIEVKGLKQALGRADYADFLDALGKGRGQMVVTPGENIAGRTALDIRPTGQPGGGGASTLSTWADDIVSQALGNVVTEGAKAVLVDRERSQELDRRFVPGIPSLLQYLYIAGFVLGLAGLGYVKRWWNAIWPAEHREEYAGAFGYHAARAVRFVLLAFVFMPLVGIPAGLWAGLMSVLQQVWWVVSLPFRALRWVWRQLMPASG